MWSHCQHQIFQSSPAIGKFSGDGRMDLVVGTGTGASGDARATNSLSAFHLDDGSPVAGWPVLLNGPIFGSPVIGDVNGDGKTDVVVAACATCNDGRVWAFTGHGHLLWDVLPGAAENDHTEILSTPILVDLNGDGVNDVAIGQAGEFYFLRGTDGVAPVQADRDQSHRAGLGRGRRLRSRYRMADDHPELAPTRQRTAQGRLGARRVVSASESAVGCTHVAAMATQPRAYRVPARAAPTREQWILDGLDQGRCLHLRQRAQLRLDARQASAPSSRRHGADTRRQGLLARDRRRWRLQLRHREVVRLGRRAASDATDRGHRGHAVRARILARDACRWHLQLRRRRVLRLDRRHAVEAAGRGYGAHSVGPWLLARDAPRRRVQLWRREGVRFSHCAPPRVLRS